MFLNFTNCGVSELSAQETEVWLNRPFLREQVMAISFTTALISWLSCSSSVRWWKVIGWCGEAVKMVGFIKWSQKPSWGKWMSEESKGWRSLELQGDDRSFTNLQLQTSLYCVQCPHHLLRCGWLMTTERLRANLKTGKKKLENCKKFIWIIRYTDEPIEYAPWGDARPYDGGFRYNCMMIQVPCHRHLYHNVIIIDYHTQHFILSIIIEKTIDSFVFNIKKFKCSLPLKTPVPQRP